MLWARDGNLLFLLSGCCGVTNPGECAGAGWGHLSPLLQQSPLLPAVLSTPIAQSAAGNA